MIKCSAMNDFSCSFARFRYNIGMQQRDTIIQKLQSATAYLETFQEKYQDKAAPLELVEPLHAVVEMLKEIHREVLIQEVRSVLHDGDLPAAKRKERLVTLFQLLTFQKIAQ
jgi:hypothetical protein